MRVIRKYPADFNQLKLVLQRERPDRPVLFEYFTNARLISKFIEKDFRSLNTPAEKIQNIIRFFYATGYDYATIPARYFSPFAFDNQHLTKKETVSLNEATAISDWNTFERFVWPNPEAIGTEILANAEMDLFDGMKMIIPGPGGLLENVINLTGFENLCFMIYENEELAKAIFTEVGSRLLAFYEICSVLPPVGALIVNDDWGFKNQTMLPPDMLRQYVFPWIKKMVEAIHYHGKPAILHSCGNISKVIADIIDDLKFDGKHSFEDNIIPVEEAYSLWHDRIAILGGIDIDFITRNDKESIKNRCQRILEISGSKGYALGSGNSIPEYVPDENYLAMISAAVL